MEYSGTSLALARKGLYASMIDKARAINERGTKSPIPELIESAKVFKEHRNTIRRRLIRGRVPQGGVLVLVK